jgi:hypothetical protein
MHHYYFPEVYNRLNEEIAWHPDLQKKLAKHTDFHLALCEVAAHCLIMVEGEYAQEDIEKLCELCLERLQQMPRINPLDQAPKIQISEDWNKFLSMQRPQ